MVEQNGNYLVSLNLDSAGSFSCQDMTKLLGNYLFSDCSILTIGNFNVLANGDDLVSGTSGPYFIKDPNLNSITISTDVLTQSTYFDIEVTVSLFDQANATYNLGSTLVSLSGTPQIFGETSGVCDNTNIIKLKIYCKEPGTTSIKAEVQNLMKSAIVTIAESQFKNLVISSSVKII